ncbi:argininosuccinate lyase [Verticillium alfalfae VaMs.102]|uniref:argininosuccinate lyase n=1 Tax=Verticillium alfalfae (strain VaMs.102 / ATCC MYA-4576 / FGSC 10136) TaxID=526221 RepID=C9S992_VERA1|nr:argininosuccinate lyase [Verticillium alfalfae VaMs.102]EEY14995.1 argininosuccinate lyase [Verticillium alfalfae VaMs.102]
MTGGLDPLMLQYNASIQYDKLLFKEDILGSIAFARANAKSGIISKDEFTEIERGLREVQKEWEADAFVIMPNDEDIHTANERRLGEIIGKDIAGKLHTGRSRNEQVACDMRLWLRNQIEEIEGHLIALIERAMPVLWSQHLLSFGFYFANDLERLRETSKRVNRSPLGCGALAGNGFNIDRDMMAEELGFADILWNSMNAGVPFRETHHISGRCVATSEKLGIPMNELSLEQLQAIDSRFGEDVAQTFDYERSVEMRSVKGGTSRSSVLEQIKVLKATLA